MSVKNEALAGNAAMPLLSAIYQHEDTGRIGYVDLWQVEHRFFEDNPRLRLIGYLVRQSDALAALAAKDSAHDKALAAARAVIRSQELRLAALTAEREKWQEAVVTLQSERDANAVLTGELADVTAQRDALAAHFAPPATPDKFIEKFNARS